MNVESINTNEEITIQSRFPRRYEDTPDTWELNTSIDEGIEKIKKQLLCLSNNTLLINDFFVRHHFYCCGTAPSDTTCWDFNDLKEVLDTCKAGDILSIWVLSVSDPLCIELCCPDENGYFPGELKIIN